MADQKATALSAFTPILSDILYGVDDPGGTPVSGKVTLTAIRDLLEDNFTALTAATGTITTSTPALDATQTWNDGAVTFTAIKMNVTDTASASGSSLFTMILDGGDFVKFKSNGKFIFPEKNEIWFSLKEFKFVTDGTDQQVIIGNSRFSIRDSGSLGWADSGNPSSTQDVSLHRDAADTLAQRRGANPQTFNIYNTFTDASNYERGGFKWATNVLEVFAEAAGTGTQRDVMLNGANRATKISDPSGGTTVDSEARTAINAIIDALEAHGISAAA